MSVAYIIAFIALSLALSFSFPGVYEFNKQNAIRQSDSLKRDSRVIRKHPFAANVMLSFSLIFYYLTGNYILSLFAALFACAAYSEMVSGWVPETISFFLFGVSVYELSVTRADTSLLSVCVFLLMPVIMSVWQKLQFEKKTLKNDDFYIIIAVGIWIQPLYAFFVMIITLLFARCTKNILELPFVTCMYVVFCIYKFLEISGLLPILI